MLGCRRGDGTKFKGWFGKYLEASARAYGYLSKYSSLPRSETVSSKSVNSLVEMTWIMGTRMRAMLVIRASE